MGILNSDKGLKIVAHVLSFIFVLVIILPLFYMANLSLQDDVAIYSTPPHFLAVPPQSISIVIDYTKHKDKSEDEIKDIVLRDSTVAMYSTIYELNKTIIGEIKVYGMMDGKTIYYSRAHSLFLRVQNQYGIYKGTAVTPRVLFFNDRYIESTKAIGYTFDLSGIPDRKYNNSLLGSREESSQIGENLNGSYKIEGDYKGGILKSNFFLALENYKYYFLMPTYRFATVPMVKKLSYFAFLFNTFITIIWATITQVSIPSLCAYPLARLLKKKIADRVMMFFLATLMIPWVCIMIPQLILMTDFGFRDSYAGMLFPWLLPAPFYIFLFKGFFEQIPSAYFEAAKIDGASEWFIFTKVCMPMSKPIITLVALQAFISGWGDFMWYYLIANKTSLWTMNVAMYTLGASPGSVTRQNFIMGLSFITILPVLVVVTIFAKQIKQGVISSGVKG
jgi:ABC-type glycerol-3-phosphate transport system permease component